MRLARSDLRPDMKKLWAGESECRPRRCEQGDYSSDNVATSGEIDNTAALDPTPLEYLKVDAYDHKFQTHLTQHHPDLTLHTLPYPDPLFGQYSRGLIPMARITGTYQHERNENLDEYFKAIGVPYVARKMMGVSSPRLEILNEDGKWTIRNVSMLRTVELSFTLGAEYEESMPSGELLKNVTTLEGDNLVTTSIAPDNSKVVRKYEFTDDSAILTMTHEKSGQVAKRFYKRQS